MAIYGPSTMVKVTFVLNINNLVLIEKYYHHFNFIHKHTCENKTKHLYSPVEYLWCKKWNQDKQCQVKSVYMVIITHLSSIKWFKERYWSVNLPYLNLHTIPANHVAKPSYSLRTPSLNFLGRIVKVCLVQIIRQLISLFSPKHITNQRWKVPFVYKVSVWD